VKPLLTTALVAVILSTSQLHDITAAGKPVNGNGGPYMQTPVKAPNVVTGKGATAVNLKGGAVYQSKGKK